jgi:hypothetical protein
LGKFAFVNRKQLITFVPEQGFQVSCPPDPTVLKSIKVVGLTVSDITGLPGGV